MVVVKEKGRRRVFVDRKISRFLQHNTRYYAFLHLKNKFKHLHPNIDFFIVEFLLFKKVERQWKDKMEEEFLKYFKEKQHYELFAPEKDPDKIQFYSSRNLEERLYAVIIPSQKTQIEKAQIKVKIPVSLYNDIEENIFSVYKTFKSFYIDLIRTYFARAELYSLFVNAEYSQDKDKYISKKLTLPKKLVERLEKIDEENRFTIPYFATKMFLEKKKKDRKIKFSPAQICPYCLSPYVKRNGGKKLRSGKKSYKCLSCNSYFTA